MRRSRPISIATDPDDDLAAAIAVEAFNDRRRGVVVADVTPGPRTDDPTRPSVLLDLADALGKPLEGRDRPDHRYTPDLLAAWLRAEPVHELVISRAHLAHGGHWRLLAEIADHAKAHLTLLVHGRSALTRSQREFSRDYGARPTDLDSVLAQLQRTQRPPAEDRAPVERPFPVVPSDSHWITFRDRCRQLLTPDDYATVVQLFDEALDQTATWLGASATVTSASVVQHLTGLIPQRAGLDQTLTIFAAVGCALWEHEWHLHCDLERLRAGIETTALAPLDDTTCEALQQELPTHTAAAAVLAVLAPTAPPEAFTGLTLGDVAADGATVTVGGRRLQVPLVARPPLRAHRFYRLSQGARRNDLFIVRRLKNRQLTPHSADSWSTLITGTGRRRGLVLTRPRSSFERHGNWSSQAGIKVVPLSTTIDRLLREAA